MAWIQAASSSELERKRRIVVRHGARQIALIRDQDRIFALDNRCPHEGYPLSEGFLPPGGCVLTCNWHNWKFDLTTGETVQGEDNLTIYETRIQDNFVWVLIPEIPREVQLERILSNLRSAFDEQQYGRMARELARLHFHGLDPLIALRKAIEWTHDRLESGMDHSFAVAADWLSLYLELKNPEEKLVCLTEAIDYMAESALRMPAFPYTGKRLPYSRESFVDAVEKEDEEVAVAMVLQALDNGMHFADLEPALTEAALRHYNDFGHSLIYLTKVGKLVELLGPEVEGFLLPPWIRSVCLATREDLLKEFRSLNEWLREWPGHSNTGAPTPLRAEELYGLGTQEAMQWVVRQAASHPPQVLWTALLQANAWSMLHYDLDLQFRFANPVSQNIGWLDFTHGVTFSSAVRLQCSKYPEFWKYGLLQMACFLGRNNGFLDRAVREEDWWVSDHESFERKALAQLLDHGRSAPIFVAHYVKTFLAAREEAALAPPECARYVLAAVRRFLESPLREKHVRRTVHQALSLVGKDFDGDGEIRKR